MEGGGTLFPSTSAGEKEEEEGLLADEVQPDSHGRCKKQTDSEKRAGRRRGGEKTFAARFFFSPLRALDERERERESGGGEDFSPICRKTKWQKAKPPVQMEFLAKILPNLLRGK